MGILNNRKLAFEISGLKEGRWTIDCIMHVEEEAVSHGRSLLSVGEFEEIRIVRHRTGPTGFTVETEILRETAPKEKKRSVALGGDPDEAPLCQDLNGFYSIEARLSIGKLLRRYLEAENITATELMHVWPYMRRLDDKASQLIGAGVFKVAEAQAKIADISVRDRATILQRFIAQAMARVRDFDYLRRKIPFSLTIWTARCDAWTRRSARTSTILASLASFAIS